ncbi:MAG: TonB-dependent receptor, partial [Longimicrobiaceae bacterium]
MTAAPGHAGRLRAALLLGLLLALAGGSRAQGAGGVVAGRVLDPEGAPVAGATVRLFRAEGAQLRAGPSDAEGAFRFEGVPAGLWRVRAERIGFAAAEAEVRLAGGESRDVELRLSGGAAVEVEGIEVRSTRDTRRERARFETEAGVTARVITGRELKVLPGLAEADVLRAIEVLPGVVSTSDFSSAFHVRGGSADQNLILLDGFPVFNPFHLGGLFSVFNSDVVARAELLAGGFGVEYGGRVSSVLGVETRDDAAPGITGEAGVSLLASRLALRSPLPALLGGDGGMAYVSARRSYFDVVLPEPVRFPYHLTDLQAGAVMGTPGGGTLRFTGYTGRDVLDLSDFDPPGDDDDAGDVLRVRWNWGNDVAGLRWSQPLGAWVADTRLGFSSFGETLGFVDFADTRFSSRIQQLTLRSDLARELSPRLGVRLGAEGNRLDYRNRSTAGGTDFFFAEDDGVLGAAYAQLRWRPDDAWIVEPGLRGDAWRAQET